MIVFHKIEITDFRSIQYAELEFKQGVWLLKGENLDDHASNGAGKTSINAAIQHALFNRNIYETNIEAASRRELDTIHPYHLKIWFYKNEDLYLVDNNRKTKTIQVYVNGVSLGIKGIQKALQTIVDIIGMDYLTFTTMTTITSDNISQLITNFSSSNLMKLVLNFQQLSESAKALQGAAKDIKQNAQHLYDKLLMLENTLRILERFQPVDLAPLQAERLRLYTATQAPELVDRLRQIPEEQLKSRQLIVDLKQEYNKLKTQRDTSVCKCCGQDLTMSAQQRLSLSQELDALQRRILEVQEQSDKEVKQLDKELAELKAKQSKLMFELRTIEGEISAAKTKNQLYEANQAEAMELRSQQEVMERERRELLEHYEIYTQAEQILKSGIIYSELLAGFAEVLNLNLSKYLALIKISYLECSAVVQKDSVEFVLFDTRFAVQIDLAALSGGERTRIRLVILLAMLETVRLVTSYSTNLLMFDEALDSLDVSATEDLKHLFGHLVHNDQKWICLVSHGQQLSNIVFNGEITAVKQNGITKVIT